MESSTVIIDNGSGMIKAGFSGEDAPRSVFPTVFGRPKELGTRDDCIGDEAIANRGELDLHYPISAGIVESWPEMEKVWGHTFGAALGVEASELHGVFMTEDVFNTKKNSEKMIQIMFETFNVQNFYVTKNSRLPVYACGYDTGLCVSVGHGVTHTTPVFKDFIVPQGVKKMEIAGHALTMWTRDQLKSFGETFNSDDEMFIA